MNVPSRKQLIEQQAQYVETMHEALARTIEKHAIKSITKQKKIELLNSGKWKSEMKFEDIQGHVKHIKKSDEKYSFLNRLDWEELILPRIKIANWKVKHVTTDSGASKRKFRIHIHAIDTFPIREISVKNTIHLIHLLSRPGINSKQRVVLNCLCTTIIAEARFEPSATIKEIITQFPQTVELSNLERDRKLKKLLEKTEKRKRDVDNTK